MRKVLLLSVLLFLVSNNDSFSQFNTSTLKLFSNNNISVYFDNAGRIGQISNDIAEGTYNQKTFLFAGGFFLTGKYGNQIFANAVASASRIEDYIPGKITKDDFSDNLFIVSTTDTPFSKSWQEWRYAVNFGAKFYDGNNDGMYNPVDLNSNKQWDVNEDKPSLIGDLTSWCVYNDGLSSALRRFTEQSSIGIEIEQTAFSFDKKGNFLDNFIFVNYKIKNKTGYTCDSVVFSPWVDFDLGNSTDDLIGSLDNYNSVFSYQKTTDNIFGSNVPTPFLSIILGPMTSIPDLSYIDKNGNNSYDAATDSALTFGYRLSNDFSIDSYPGYININNNSSNWYIQSDPNQGDPSFVDEARNYSLGLNKVGKLSSPCNSNYAGTVLNSLCDTINPYFPFSGDPFINKGWLNITPTDYRVQNNSGLFKLEPDVPVEILVAYHIGEGSSTEEGYRKGKAYLDSLFNQLGVVKYFPTSVQDNSSIEITNYELYNCYPNPFNPSTTIRYSVPQDNQVVIKVFDVLGNEVSTLVDDFVNKGTYEVKFDASNLASGMYFYTLKSGNFTSTKKMILIK